MKSAFILPVALLVLAGSIQARTINWGSSFEDIIVDSAGTGLSAVYTFELGSFGSFIPDQSNLEQWAANWKPFDLAQSPATWDPSNGFFSSSADVLDSPVSGTSSSTTIPASPVNVFGPGERGYIWAYNTKTLAVGTTEWALVTNDSTDGNAADDWLFPSSADHSSIPLQWRLPIASHVVFGGLNDVQGPGDYTPPTSSFALQTHTISVVPEPSGALLVTLAGVAVSLRRRRQ